MATGYEMGMRKIAAKVSPEIPGRLGEAAGRFNLKTYSDLAQIGEAGGKVVKGLILPATLAMSLGAYGLKKVINKIQNDTNRKALLEDLMNTDPIIKKGPKEDVLKYYATIYNVAPDLSKDKNAVREILQSAVKFGRMDIQTIKSMTEIERNMQQGESGVLRTMLMGM